MTMPYIAPVNDAGVVGRYSDLALHFRASDLSVYPLRGVPVYSRTSTAMGRDSRGKWFEFTFQQPAWEYYDLDGDGIFETPTLALDDLYTNILPWGADLTQWTKVAAPTVVLSDSLGSLPLWKVDDNSASIEYVESLDFTSRFAVAGSGKLLITLTKGDVSAVGGWEVIVRDRTNSVNRCTITGNWTGIVPTATLVGCTLEYTRYIGLSEGGRSVYQMAFDLGGTLTLADHRLWLRPATTAAQVGDVYFGPAQIVDRATSPATLMLNATAGYTAHGGDEWRVPYNAYCSPITFWIDAIEHGTIYAEGARLLSIGSITANPQITIVVIGGKYGIYYDNGTTAVSPVLAGTMPILGQRFQLYGFVDVTGAALLGINVENAGWVYTALTGPNALPRNRGWSGWPSSSYIHLGHSVSSGESSRIIEAKVARAALPLASIAGSGGW